MANDEQHWLEQPTVVADEVYAVDLVVVVVDDD